MKCLLFFVFLFILLLNKSMVAQDSGHGHNTGIITGTILENQTEKPIPFATVMLLKLQPDSAGKRSLVADKNGYFEFENISYGYYKLNIQAIGFSHYILDSINERAEKSAININSITMKIASASLTEVVVYAEKPLIENKDGKLIYNVGESALNNGASTAEMLKNMPLVNADPDGNLFLRGKPPLILMDEKPTNLGGMQLQDFLESLPANVVERVEIMLNPPPEYASYDGGVINIITKKGRVGLYARFALSYGSKGEVNSSSNFNYRSNKLNINANLGYGYNRGIGNSYSHRENIYADSVNYINTEANYNNFKKYPNFHIQSDYEFNKRNKIDFTYQGNANYFDNSSFSLYTNLDSLKNPWKASSRDNHYNGSGYGQGISASYLWKGINPVERLQIQTGYNFGKNDNLHDFYQSFLFADLLPTGEDSTQNQFTDNYYSSGYFRANYNTPLNDTGTQVFTTGTSFSQNNYHNILNTNWLNTLNNEYQLNDLFSNDFLFQQSIFTVRAGFIFSLPQRFKLIPNLQDEYTYTNFNFFKGNATNVNNGYWKILPGLTLRKDFTQSLNMAWVFRQSIRRPGMGELNPSIDYRDPYNIRFGNPALSPALTDIYDFNINYVKNKFNINGSVGFNKIRNVFNSVRTLIDDGKTQTTYQNIAGQREYQASLATGITVNRKLRINMYAGYNYNQYSSIQKSLFNYKNSGSLVSSFSFSYAPNNLTIINANTNYSKYANPQGKSRNIVTMIFGVQRKFLNKKMVVAINVIDPFGLVRYSNYTTAPNYIIESHSLSNSKNFRITMSYQVSKVKLRKAKGQ